MDQLDTIKRDQHWNNIHVITNTDEIDFHSAGADRDIALKPLTNAEKLYLWYRFLLEEKIIIYLVGKYVKNYSHALDCGAGTGRLSLVLSKHFLQVDSFDISQIFKTEFNKLYPYIKNVNFDVANFETFNTDKKYDVVIIAGVFMCMTDDEVKDALKKVQKWLSPTGILICRDTLAWNKAEFVNSTKTYRTEGEYLTLFHQNFLTLKILDGANRNLVCSIFLRIPNFLKTQGIVFNFFKNIVSMLLYLDFISIIIRSKKRHELSNQRFYVFKSK